MKIIWEPIESPEEGLMTPQGAIDIKVLPNEVYKFEFWAGFTNFPLTRKHKAILNKTPGVESLTIMTPYRFVISVGKLFSMNKVRKSIEDAIIGKKEDHVTTLRQQMQAYQDWVIYILPTGEISYSTSEDKDFSNKLQIFNESYKSIGGQLVRPRDQE